MKAWAASALATYYRDPEVIFLGRGGTVTAAGFYIVPHCDPDCCEELGLSKTGLGPFLTPGAARAWSRENIVHPDD